MLEEAKGKQTAHGKVGQRLGSDFWHSGGAEVRIPPVTHMASAQGPSSLSGACLRLGFCVSSIARSAVH